MSAAREPFARYRELMSLAGFRPSRRLGQNFLLDPSLHRFIVETAGLRADDLVLEIGAGLGFLTRELIGQAGRVVAVEIDPRLCAILDREFARELAAGQLSLVCADVLDAGELRSEVEVALAAEDEPEARLVVVANLPYKVAGPLLSVLARLAIPPAVVVVVVQLELAERLVAAPGTAVYGALSAMVQGLWRAQLVRRVGAQVFRPRPRVDSALVALVVDPDRPLVALPGPARREFGTFVRALFSQRRKQLRNLLPRAAAAIHASPPQAVLDSSLASRRPQEFSSTELVELWQACQPSNEG